jgi:hypothetical protein
MIQTTNPKPFRFSNNGKRRIPKSALIASQVKTFTQIHHIIGNTTPAPGVKIRKLRPFFSRFFT